MLFKSLTQLLSKLVILPQRCKSSAEALAWLPAIAGGGLVRRLQNMVMISFKAQESIILKVDHYYL